MRIQQIFKSRAHGKVHLPVRIVAVLVVVRNHQENGQTNRLRCCVLKLCPAVIFGSALRLRDQAFDILIFFVMLDAQMDFDFLNRQNQGASPPSFFCGKVISDGFGCKDARFPQHSQ